LLCNFNFPIGEVSNDDAVYPNKEPIIANQHGNIQDAIKEFKGIDLEKYFKFTFVRNPWERYFSYFKYTYREPSQLTIENFKSLVYEMKDYQPKGFSPLEPQSHWFLNKGEIIVDFIGCVENIKLDLEFISKKLNLNLKIPTRKINKSIEYLDKKNFYTQELIDIVAEKEIDVIKLKNYTF
jgi:hypothetical protein